MTGVGPDCRYSLNPYHECDEYCIKIITEAKKTATKNEGLHPDCRYLSNPYHVCNEYCFKIITERKKPSRKNEGLHPDCRFLSNPYHECNEYCFKIIAEAKKPSGKTEERHPDCKYLSNPYHECDEYCLKMIADAKKLATNNELDGLEADSKRRVQPTLIVTELPNDNDDVKSDEWKRLFGEISKLNHRVDQLETYQNENRKEVERRHIEILQRLDLLQQQTLIQH